MPKPTGRFFVLLAICFSPTVLSGQTGPVKMIDERLGELISADAQLEVLADGFQWSEGPLWLENEQKLIFSDVPQNTVFSWSEENGIEVFLKPAGYTGKKSRGGGLGSNGLALDKLGQLVLCQHGDRRVARMVSDVLQPEPAFETLASDFKGKRFNSPNDLAFDRSGNLYFTDPPYGLEQGDDDPRRELDWSGIYRLTPGGEVILLYKGLSRPNGIALSPDEKTLYVANSDPQEATWTSFRIEPDGSLTDPTVFHDATGDVESKPGLPDGLKVDTNGNIFATGPGGILVFSPKGDLLGTIDTGEPTANLAFNSDESMLYITANDKLMRLPIKTAEVSSTQQIKAVFEHFTYQGQAMEQVTVKPTEYRNPILSGYYPDPSLARVKNDYYLVNSTFTHYPGLPVFHSTDLVNWSQISNAISRRNQLDFNGLTVSRGIFAPDISYNDGLYYITSTCVDCGGNFVITAKDPAGPWSDPAWLDFEGIDPSIYWEGDKAFILNNGAPPEPPQYEGHRAIWIQAFDWENLQMRGDRKVLVNGGVDITEKPIWIEGPHIFRRGDYYYLTAAEGGTADQHSQTIFRSKSVWGPFQPAKRNPILTQRDLDPARSDPVTSAGHAKFVQLPNGDWWATFLATRPYGPDLYNIGRETFLLPVTWENGWPGILPAGELIPYVHSRPALPLGEPPLLPTSGDFGFTEEFDGTTLSMEWIGIRTPGNPVYTLGGGQLAMDCAGAFGDLSGPPSFIGRRQQHHVATASTTFSFSPKTHGDRAGLAAVQNDSSLIFFGTERIDDQNYLVISTRDKSNEDLQVKKISLAPAENLTLSMRINGGKMDFEYSQNGEKFNVAKGMDARILSTSRAGGFVGTLIGLYCESKSVNTDT